MQDDPAVPAGSELCDAELREAAAQGSDEVVEGLIDIAGVCVREADRDATTASAADGVLSTAHHDRLASASRDAR